MKNAFSNRALLLALPVGMIAVASTADAATMAYWRFEDGSADTDVIHAPNDPNSFQSDVLDASPNGNNLSAWLTGGDAGEAYRASIPGATTAAGLPNTLSIQNTGSNPGLWNESLNTWNPSAFTVEVSFNVEAGGWMTLVGRDGRDIHSANGELAPMYFQVVDQGNAENGNALKFLFADNDGNSHQVFSDALDRFDFANGPDSGTWYSAAAVSDGSTLSLYLMNMSTDTGYSLVDSVDLGTGDTRLATGNGDGGDWDAGNFTVMRGMYNGGHGDRTYGLIDEVRLSDEALTSFVFGDVVPEPASAALVGLGAMALFGRRRRQA